MDKFWGWVDEQYAISKMLTEREWSPVEIHIARTFLVVGTLMGMILGGSLVVGILGK